MNENGHHLEVEDDDETVALAVAAGGLFVFLAGLIFGSRVLRVLGLLAAVAGGGIFAKRKLETRSEKIDAAESRIRSELDDLDPVARAQVLADIAT